MGMVRKFQSLKIVGLLWIAWFASLPSLLARPPVSETLRTEGPVVIVADVHGDLNALLAILRHQGLIDTEGHWIGEKASLIFLGDLIDRHMDSFFVLEFVRRLEEQAFEAGGQVVALLGNHEVMVTEGDFHYVGETEASVYEELAPGGLRGVFQAPSPYADWFRRRPVVLKLKPKQGPAYLLVHGGFENWVWDYSFENLNQMSHEWMRYHQGLSLTPPSEGEWLFDSPGPIWSRAFFDPLLREEQMSPRDLSDFLHQHQARAVIVGHTLTETISGSNEILTRTPFMGSRVIAADTGISSVYKGSLSAIRIQNGRLHRHYVPRPNRVDPLVEQNRARCSDILKAWIDLK